MNTTDQIAAVPSIQDGLERELMANEPSTSGHYLTKADQRQRAIDMFIRICRDSGFQIGAVPATILLAKTLGRHPLTMWADMDIDLGTLERVASGEHPAAHRSAA